MKKIFVILSIAGGSLSVFISCNKPRPQSEKPSNYPGSLSFYVIGDWGRDGMHGQREVSEAMTKATTTIAPKFIISTGDNFLP